MPRVAVGFYGADFDSGNTGLVDAVVAEIERQGAEAVPVFGYPAGLAFETLLLDDSGEARVDVAMAFLFRFAGPDAGSSLARFDVPVLSLISLYGRGEQEWRESEMGLSLFEGTFQVVSPELAGLVAPTVVGSQERIADPDTGLTIVARRPIPSRVAMAVRRALRYAALAATPNAGKRLALRDEGYDLGVGRRKRRKSWLPDRASAAPRGNSWCPSFASATSPCCRSRRGAGART